MTNLTYIYNGQIVLETGIIWDGAMVIADGIIREVGKERELPCPAGAAMTPPTRQMLLTMAAVPVKLAKGMITSVAAMTMPTMAWNMTL